MKEHVKFRRTRRSFFYSLSGFLQIQIAFIFRKQVDKEEELETTRKNHQRQIEAMQASIEGELKSKGTLSLLHEKSLFCPEKVFYLILFLQEFM